MDVSHKMREYAAVAAMLLIFGASSHAQTGTQVELTTTDWHGVTVADSASEGIVTLKAKVAGASKGTVVFSDGKSGVLASSQIQDQEGDARARVRLATGAHHIYATYLGTNETASGVSADKVLNVTARSIPELNNATGTVHGLTDAWADLRSCGLQDYISISADQLTVRMASEDGIGKPTTYDLPTKASALAIGDMNSDGFPDVVVRLGGAISTLAIMLGKGDGTFAAPILTSSGITDAAAALVVGDFDGDGNVDVATTRSGALATFVGDGKGGLSAGLGSTGTLPPGYVTAMDVNGDGKQDLVVSDGTSFKVLDGLGDGRFTSASPVGSLGIPSQPVAAPVEGATPQSQSSTNGGLSLTFSTPLVTPQGPAFPPTGLSNNATPSIQVSVLSNGSVATTNTDTILLEVSGPNGYYLNYQVQAVNGVASFPEYNPASSTEVEYPFVAGAYTYTASDPGATAVTSDVTVIPGLVFEYALKGIPSSQAVAGVPLKTTIYTTDSYANQVASNGGTINASSTDATATFNPQTHTFTTADGGQFDFFATLNTPGTQVLYLDAPLGSFSYNGAADQKLQVVSGTPPNATVTTLSVTPLYTLSAPSKLYTATVTATVTSGGKPVTEGTVTFYEIGVGDGPYSLDSSGSYSLLQGLGDAGQAPYIAHFNGTANYSQSTSGTVLQETLTAPIPTTGALAASANAVTYGTAVTFTLTLSASHGTPTGSVTFYDGAASIGTSSVTNGSATLSPSLFPGQHSISAVFAGDGGGAFSAVTTPAIAVVVTGTVPLTLVTSVPSLSVTAGESANFTVTVSSSDPISLTYSGEGAGQTVTFSSATTTPFQSVFSATFVTTTSAENHNPLQRPLDLMTAALLLLVPMVRRRRTVPGALAVMLLCCIGSLTGCSGATGSTGGGGGGTTIIPARHNNITLTATDTKTNATATASVAVTVN